MNALLPSHLIQAELLLFSQKIGRYRYLTQKLRRESWKLFSQELLDQKLECSVIIFKGRLEWLEEATGDPESPVSLSLQKDFQQNKHSKILETLWCKAACKRSTKN